MGSMNVFNKRRIGGNVTNELMYKEKLSRNIIKALAVILMLTGLSLLVVLVWRIVFDNNLPELSMPIVYLTALAITSGLLGSFFEEVMVKIGVEKYKEIYQEEYINQIIEKRESEETQEKNLQVTNEMVAIVAVGDTYHWNVQHNIYYCQSNRPIKEGINYIAFYKNKTITKLYNFNKVNEADLLSGKVALPIQFSNNDIPNVYMLSLEEDLNITHNRSGAYIQSRKYVSYDDLLKAKNKTTANI